jgi:hypothetical protein
MVFYQKGNVQMFHVKQMCVKKKVGVSRETNMWKGGRGVSRETNMWKKGGGRFT